MTSHAPALFLSSHDINWKRVILDSFNKAPLSEPKGLTPREFLDFAREDFKVGSPHGYVNALSNAKRAVDCQVEGVLASFGLAKRNRGFPTKLDVLSEMGFVAPAIVKKLSHTRNLLEHEFRAPKRAETADALDVAALFVESADPLLQNFPDDMAVGNLPDEHAPLEHMSPVLTIRFNSKLPRLEIEEGYNLGGDSSDSCRIVSVAHPDYFATVHLFAAFVRRHGCEFPLARLSGAKTVHVIW